MLLLGEGSEATEPYNKHDKIRPHSIRSLLFDQKVRPLSFRPEKFDLFYSHPEHVRGNGVNWKACSEKRGLPSIDYICKLRQKTTSSFFIKNVRGFWRRNLMMLIRRNWNSRLLKPSVDLRRIKLYLRSFLVWNWQTILSIFSYPKFRIFLKTFHQF